MSGKLGLKIKHLLLQKGASQKELAKHCGITPQFVSYIIRGNKNASMGTIQKIADFLGTSIDYLFESETDNGVELYSGDSLPPELIYLYNDRHLCKEFNITNEELKKLASHKFYNKTRDFTKAEWIRLLLVLRSLQL